MTILDTLDGVAICLGYLTIMAMLLGGFSLAWWKVEHRVRRWKRGGR